MDVAYHRTFLKRYKRLPKELQKEADQKIELFKKDHKDPSLKTHKLKGRFRAYQAFSVNYAYRIVFEILGDRAFLIDIGDHDIYK